MENKFVLPENAQELLQEAVESERAGMQQLRGDLVESREIRRHLHTGELFAVFDYDARKLDHMEVEDGGNMAHFWPAFIEGKTYLSRPAEGRVAVLYWCRIKRPDRPAKIRPMWRQCGWLRIEELDQTPGQIWENISDDIDAGNYNPFTDRA